MTPGSPSRRAAGETNVMLTLAYDGTDFAGWQVQQRQRTVQGTLEAALERILGRPLRVRAAGRTDSGVHAVGQVANFTAPMSFPAERWAVAVNSCLPPDVRVLAARPVAAEFDARRSALARAYHYQLLTGPVGLPHLRRYCYHVRRRLDLRYLNRAAACLVGEHDFTVFAAAGDPSPLQGAAGNQRCLLSAYSIRGVPHRRHLVPVEDGAQHRGHAAGAGRDRHPRRRRQPSAGAPQARRGGADRPLARTVPGAGVVSSAV